MKCPICRNELTKVNHEHDEFHHEFDEYHHEYNPDCPLSTDNYDMATWERIGLAGDIRYHIGYMDGYDRRTPEWSRYPRG